MRQRCCRREEQDAIVRLASGFAVFSPNLLEMQAILGLPADSTQEGAEQAAHAFHDLLSDPRGTAVIVRAGSMGSYTISDSWTGWVPAYWTASQQDKVVDPTGGGNAWLGGLMAGLLLSDDDMRIGESSGRVPDTDTVGSIYGSVAASFTIQQRGLPVFDGTLWNGDDPQKRLQDMQQRVK